MAFTASEMNQLKLKLDRMFAAPHLVDAALNQPAMFFRALAENQTAFTDPILKGNQCTGVQAWYVDTSGDAEVAASTDCTTPGGTTLGTLAVEYNSAVIAAAAKNGLSARCNNELTRDEELMSCYKIVFASLRKQLNEFAVNKALALAQVNISPLDFAPTWTEVGTEIQIPRNELTWDALGGFNTLADLNNIGPYISVSGYGSFWNEWWKANHTQYNDNERSAFSAFQQQSFYWDKRSLDQIVGAPTTFLIGVNNYIFWNNSFSSNVPTAKFYGSNGVKYTFVMPDPELKYMLNGVPTPVMYEFEMEVSCNDRNAIDELQEAFKIYGRVIGGLEGAPTGPDGETGFIQITGV